LEGEVHGHDYEVDEARWFPLSEALAKLSFATEQKMMRRAKRFIDAGLSRPATRGDEMVWRH
jgi:predicted NUDIX family NTP pyrophosphohydrolase